MGEKKRWLLIDELRGLVIVSMIGYHAVWNMVYLFGRNVAWYEGWWGRLWQQSICWSFILLSGFCWSLGRHPVKRGAEVFGAGLLVTAISQWIEGAEIYFGVLSLIGASMMLLTPLETILRRVQPFLGVGGCMGLYALFKDVGDGYLAFGVALPQGLYQNLITASLGFPPAGFYSTDYFSILPWFFVFLAGYFCYKWGEGRWKKEKKLGISIFSWLGQHSLAIYLLHQPIIFGLQWMLTSLIG